MFSVLRRVPLPRHLTGALEAESGLDDAPVLLVALVSTGAALDHGVLGFAGIGQGGGAFADVAGATALSYSLNATSGDSGAMFRAALACSGQSGATAQAATLTASAPWAARRSPRCRSSACAAMPTSTR